MPRGGIDPAGVAAEGQQILSRAAQRDANNAEVQLVRLNDFCVAAVASVQLAAAPEDGPPWVRQILEAGIPILELNNVPDPPGFQIITLKREFVRERIEMVGLLSGFAVITGGYENRLEDPCLYSMIYSDPQRAFPFPP